MRGVGDAVDPAVFAWGRRAGAALGSPGSRSPAALRARLGRGGYGLPDVLAPVLPLRNHAYHYYLYLPLTAAAWCAAAAADARAPPRAVARARQTAPALAGAAVLLTVNGALLREQDRDGAVHPPGQCARMPP